MAEKAVPQRQPGPKGGLAHFLQTGQDSQSLVSTLHPTPARSKPHVGKRTFVHESPLRMGNGASSSFPPCRCSLESACLTPAEATRRTDRSTPQGVARSFARAASSSSRFTNHRAIREVLRTRRAIG